MKAFVLFVFLGAFVIYVAWGSCVSFSNSNPDVVGQWEVVKDRPNCGWEKPDDGGTSNYEFLFAPNGEAQENYVTTGPRAFWVYKKGRWSQTGPSLTVDITSSTRSSLGTETDRVVTTYKVIREDNWLRLRAYERKRYGKESFARLEPPEDWQKCAMLFRMIGVLVR
jgi:hypothetical protein